MSELKLEFAPIAMPAKGVLILFCEEGLKFGAATQKLLKPTGNLIARAAEADRFKGKNGAALDIVAPPGLHVSRLVVVGAGKAADLKSQGYVKLGGAAMGKAPGREEHVTIVADLPGGMKPDRAADMALGVRLRAYSFDRYKTKRKEGEEPAETGERQDRGVLGRAGAEGIRVAGGRGGRRRAGPRPGERTRQRALSGGIRPPRQPPRKARGRRRDLRRRRDDQARNERAARRRPGLGARQPHGDHALERRQARRQADRVHRQGRLLRYRRRLDQAGVRHGGHEGRHGGRGLRRRPDARARGAQGQGQRGRCHRARRERGRRQGAAPRRHRQDHVGTDDRDHQHRRRGPARAGRRAALRQQALQAEVHARSGDADRRDHRRARAGICRAVLQRRQAGRSGWSRPARRPASGSGRCRSGRNTTR